MAKIINAFADNAGHIHESAEDAVIADISNVLGRIGAEAGLTLPIARTILAKRSEIEAIFAELDTLLHAMTGRAAA